MSVADIFRQLFVLLGDDHELTLYGDGSGFVTTNFLNGKNARKEFLSLEGAVSILMEVNQ